MGPSKLWLPTLIIPAVLLLLIHLHYADAQIERTMRHWKHREPGVCSGSSNGLSSPHSPDRYNDLRIIYQNCTRVFGNVEITHLNATLLGNRTIDFLDDIEEVKGYILIYGIKMIRRISFKKLKIIWGDTLWGGEEHGGALFIDKTVGVEAVSMPSLRTIEKGNVHVGTSHLCYLQDTVNPDELLNFDRSRYLPETIYTANRSRYCLKHKVRCHLSCNGNCWGPTENDCQTVYRSTCPSFCESRQCYLDKEVNQTRCCHSQCIAGCSGPFASDCNYCNNFMQCKEDKLTGKTCKCVEQCTSLRKYNKESGQVEENPDGYYSVDNRHCEKECPAGRLVQDDVCVEHCGPGMYYDMNKGDKICRKCDGACPKSCKFDQILSSENINELQNCTEIEGFIEIRLSTFTPHDEPAKNGKPERHVPGLSISDLDALRTVRFISEYLYIAADDANIKSLSFLENLEIIDGRKLFNSRQALAISMNHNLDHIGLRKLKKIAKGDVVITKNTDLCYTDSFDWKDIVVGPNATSTFISNRDKRVCQMEDKQCHQSCDPAFGCWGPSNADCRKCNHWLQNGVCVEKCSQKGFYENETTRTCEPCYRECDTCKGPLLTHCLSCRSMKLYRPPGNALSSTVEDDYAALEEKMTTGNQSISADTTISPETTLSPSEPPLHPAEFTQMTCVPECPSARFYVRDGECARCHKSCYDFGCDGPLNMPGRNGCVKCKYAQIDKPHANSSIGAVTRCLHSPDKHSNSICSKNNLLDHFVQVTTHASVEEFECAPCEDECATCQSKGTSRILNKCKCKNFVGYGSPYHKGGGPSRKLEERCIAQCWNGMFLDNSTIEEGVAGVCRQCHPLCERGGQGEACTGPHDSDCTRCGLAHAYKYEDGEKLMCVASCEEIGLFKYDKLKSCHKVDLERRDRIHKAIIYSIGVVVFLLILIGALLCWRRQKRLSKELEQEKVANNPEMPELIPMELNGPKANREKMNLIPKQSLARSAKELGRGAFGVVYAGCWMPLGRHGKPTKVPVAIKVVHDPTGRAQAELVDEATKMSMLRHENLLRIVGVCLSGDDLQLVTLLRPLGNLREFLQKHRGKLSGKELLQYSYQIASGMKYLADQRVVHRDLAARNVLVKNIHHVEITDFGLAKLIEIGTDSVQVGEGKVAIKWLAIEALEKQVYNTATDVWAFGVTVWEILTYGESPYNGMSPMTIKEFLMNGQRLGQPSNCNIELYKYLIDCWLPNPDSRPTFAILKENFYKCCRAPWYFVNETEKNSPFELDNCSQRGLIEEMLDETDFEDPQNYFESEPNTPGCANTGDVFNPAMAVRRMDSVGSQRYAQDPTTRKDFGMDDGNYLVPNSHVAEVGATMYTPVVVDASGNSSLVESLGYYNEVNQGSDYVNDTQAMKKSLRSSRDDRLSMVEEDDEIIEKESCL